MKRITAISMILSLLLTAMQPAVVLHYCKGSLYSVGFIKNELPKSCCSGSEHKNCCSNRILKITTDDFQIQQPVSGGIVPLILSPVLFVLSDNLYPSESPDLLLLQQIFPPGGLARRQVDLLAFVGNFRI
jgi:hypothetical protein